MFLEQLYDLHRAIAIQKLLMQNCPEVQQVGGVARVAFRLGPSSSGLACRLCWGGNTEPELAGKSSEAGCGCWSEQART